MDIYKEMAKHPVFSIADVNQFYNNVGSARSAVKRMMHYAKALKIRNDMYTCISMENDCPIANRFQIASAISETSYISHHTAMEYYGISDQVYNEVYVSSDTRFQDFEFDGYTYHYIKSRLAKGIGSPKYSGGIKVTDKERTIADCLKDMDKIAGPEEVYANICSMSYIDEQKLLEYLSLYDNQFLYQKAGFLLWDCREALGLTDGFFDICREHIGKSKRYLTKDNCQVKYIDEWRLMVPVNILNIKNGEVETDAAV
jgi:predicted transcriptional regulator of viral defense system